MGEPELFDAGSPGFRALGRRMEVHLGKLARWRVQHREKYYFLAAALAGLTAYLAWSYLYSIIIVYMRHGAALMPKLQNLVAEIIAGLVVVIFSCCVYCLRTYGCRITALYFAIVAISCLAIWHLMWAPFTSMAQRSVVDFVGFELAKDVPRFKSDLLLQQCTRPVQLGQLINTGNASCEMQEAEANRVGPIATGNWNVDKFSLKPITPFKIGRRNEPRPLKLMEETNTILETCSITSAKTYKIASGLVVKAGGVGAGTLVISLGSSGPSNVYHVLHAEGTIYCTFLATQRVIHGPMYGVSGNGKPLNFQMESVFRAMIPRAESRFLTLASNTSFLSQHLFRELIIVHKPGGMGMENYFPLWDDYKLERFRPKSPFGLQFANVIRNSLLAGPGKRNSYPVVVLVQRSGNRRLVGMRTGSFAEVVSALCKRGVPVKIAEFDSSESLEDIAELLSNAAMLVAVHGAAIANAFLLPEDTTVLEVTLRREYYHQGGGYDRVCYTNMMQYFGHRYYYYDPKYILPRSSLRQARHVVVNAEHFADVVSCALAQRLKK